MRTIVARTWGAAVPGNPADGRCCVRLACGARRPCSISPAMRAMPDVRATAITQVRQLQSRLTTMATAGDAAAAAHVTAARHDIQRFLDGNDKPELRPRYPVLTLPWP